MVLVVARRQYIRQNQKYYKIDKKVILSAFMIDCKLLLIRDIVLLKVCIIELYSLDDYNID